MMNFAVNHNATRGFLASEIDKNFLGAVAVTEIKNLTTPARRSHHGDASGGAIF